jgi:hypothetical protein
MENLLIELILTDEKHNIQNKFAFAVSTNLANLYQNH